jgi:uncharacterized protein (UPF0335 family)
MIDLTKITTPGSNSKAELKNFIERIERLEEEKKALSEDIKQVYAESKATGFDTKVIRKVIAARRMDPDDRRTLNEMIETYLHALEGGADDEETLY